MNFTLEQTTLLLTHFKQVAGQATGHCVQSVQTADSGSVLAVAEADSYWFCVAAPGSDWLCVSRK